MFDERNVLRQQIAEVRGQKSECGCSYRDDNVEDVVRQDQRLPNVNTLEIQINVHNIRNDGANVFKRVRGMD